MTTTLKAIISFGPMDKFHRATCGHGKRSLASGNAVEVEGPVARIVNNAMLTEADGYLRPCGICRPERNGIRA